LRDKGHTVLFISHRLAEVFTVADRISILRRGRLIGTHSAKECTAEEIARYIVSEEKPSSGVVFDPGEAPERKPGKPEPSLELSPLLEFRRITAPSSEQGTGLSEFSLVVHEGEILGIGAVVGNGERAIARTAAGVSPVDRGEILFSGRSIARLPIAARLKLGLQWLPANPLEEALLPSRPVWENFLLGSQHDRRFQSWGWLLESKIFGWADERLKEAEVVYPGLKEPVSALSGGNQQKLALARVLAGPPRLAILEQPGRGLDIRAQARLREHLLDLNRKGVSFLVISYDLEELLSLSHRIGIVYRGELMGMVKRKDATRETLGKWMLGIAREEDAR
jgi:simple sugar transport system ATP-binding protein